MDYDGAAESWRDDLPWDEFDWEAFLQEQDERTERYMELEAKYRELPDAEERIAHEMGWEAPPCFGAEPPESDECDKRSSCDWSEAAADEAPFEDLAEEEPHAYEEDPLWHRAHEVAVRLHGYFRFRPEACESAGASELLRHSAMVAAKIAGGRSMGFSRDALGGNIANHKRAMSHVLRALAALDEAERFRAISSTTAARFRRGLLGVRERLMGRIVELREMFYSGQFIDD